MPHTVHAIRMRNTKKGQAQEETYLSALLEMPYRALRRESAMPSMRIENPRCV